MYCWRSVPLPCGRYNGHFYLLWIERKTSKAWENRHRRIGKEEEKTVEVNLSIFLLCDNFSTFISFWGAGKHMKHFHRKMNPKCKKLSCLCVNGTGNGQGLWLCLKSSSILVRMDYGELRRQWSKNPDRPLPPTLPSVPNSFQPSSPITHSLQRIPSYLSPRTKK